MLVNIKHLSKNKVFASLYNHAANGYENITDEEAQQVISSFKSRVYGPGPLYFDYFDAKRFLAEGNERGFGAVPMKIDLTSDYIESEGYDKLHEEGKVEELVNQLRQEKVKELKKIIDAAVPNFHERLFGTTRELKTVPNIQEACAAYIELSIDIQNYARIVEATSEKKRDHNRFFNTNTETETKKSIDQTAGLRMGRP